MTIKEAILKSLDEINGLTTYMDIYNNILKHNYYDFGQAKTPAATISALLGDFIRNGDSRVKRIKQVGGTYSYYLTKNEQNIGIDVLTGVTKSIAINLKQIDKLKTYEERDLHKLLSTFLKSHGISSKTIFHEKSSNSKDKNQKWIHPDMVGIAFLKLETKVSQAFLKTVNREDTFKLNSYEIKKEINTDYELKEAFFQAVSNSSWANHGYLVAFEINESLHDEMKRLNQSFGIGVIELRANPYESKVLFASKFKNLDFKTIDKLCKINHDFEKFIEQTEKVMTASDKYINAIEKELEEFCDKYLQNDSEIETYCKEKNISSNQ
ncbi:MAG: hypothetical protein HYU68_04230 [Bacteroidetes bacterium]|nr:hypothetical protein [Bacteroidota bacterium]